MNAIAATLRKDYVKVIEELMFLEPTSTQARLASQDNVFTENVILVGTYRRIPFILTHKLTLSMQDGKIIVSASGLMMDKRLRAGKVEHVHGGVLTGVPDVVENEAWKSQPSLVETARSLVAYQISRTAEVSGYPIHVVEITADGKVNWFNCDPQCAFESRVSTRTQ